MTVRRTLFCCRSVLLGLCLATFGGLGFAGPREALAEKAAQVFRAGAVAMDVSPLKFPVIINGNMNEVLATEVLDPLHARLAGMLLGTRPFLG